MTQGNDRVVAAINALKDHSTLKVWSVLVTFFGDLAATPKTHLTGPVLAALVQPIGIKPEALRVALHRLRKDGWIETSRSGRVSLYALTDYGRQQTNAVRQRVYGAAPERPGDWHIVITAPHGAADPAHDLLKDAIPVSGNTYLLPSHPQRTPPNAFVGAVRDLSTVGWVRDKIAPPDIAAAYRDLDTALKGVARNLRSIRQGALIEQTILRTLILHNWRRILLRHPAAADFAIDGWAGSECRRTVLNLLEEIERPSPDALVAALHHPRATGQGRSSSGV